MHWLIIVTLALLQSSVTSINWLYLAAGWLGVKEKWVGVFGTGLVLDLIGGGRLGLSSVKFLLVAGGVWLVWQYWPMRLQKQLRLRFD